MISEEKVTNLNFIFYPFIPDTPIRKVTTNKIPGSAGDRKENKNYD